jgi:hypothetical protein
MTQIAGYMLHEILSLPTCIQNMQGQIHICPPPPKEKPTQ